MGSIEWCIDLGRLLTRFSRSLHFWSQISKNNGAF